MKTRLKKTVSGIAVLFATGTAVGAGCPPVADGVWQAAMMAASSSISGGIVALVEAVSVARAANLMLVQSTIRITAKQIEVTGEKQSATELAAKEGAANFQVELANRKAILETTMQYNAATGQGFDPCGEVRRSQNIAVAVGEANTGMPDRVMRELDAAPGRLVTNQADIVSKRLADGKALYCTPEQAKAGFCQQPSPLAGKDLDAGHFFTTYQVGSPEAQAKSALLNNMYGIPYSAPDKSVVNSPAGKSFFESKRTEDAYRSVSQAIMKTLQSWTESRSGSGDGSDSVLGAIAAKVGTYSGGSNYAAWELKKASESEHGLLVELAKMRAFELYMRNLEYQQLDLEEAALAALLPLRARGGNDGSVSSERAAQRSKVQ